VKKDKASLKTDGCALAKGTSETAAKKSARQGQAEGRQTSGRRRPRRPGRRWPVRPRGRHGPAEPFRARSAFVRPSTRPPWRCWHPSPLRPIGPSRTATRLAKGKRRRRVEPPPAVNEPLAFITFVAAHPLGSTFEGVVASFTSHGAMVDVGLEDGGVLHCYAPLAGLGAPPPRAAREVLTRGQHREFSLVALDPPRRMAELALPELAPVFLGGRSAGSKAAG
jgi:hypothetical protein